MLWKPSDTALLSNWWIFKICREAGVPPGVVNFVPCEGPVFGDAITSSPYLAGLNFTGSVPTFNRLWAQVGQNLFKYRNYPKLIGECGGKNYHFVHSSADVESVINATIKSAFEYNGQKCSACSRMYVPESLWGKVSENAAVFNFSSMYYYLSDFFKTPLVPGKRRSLRSSQKTQDRRCSRFYCVHRRRYRRHRV